ncbi:MAG TPA: hypothetical protein VFQ22_06100, partial [Longimicrobiales bacterium]|nr:hypothetical protein [Longimicrobiales bacterium]
LPLRVPAAELTLAGGRATWNGVVVQLGADSLRTRGLLTVPEGGLGAWLRGEAPPEIEAELTGGRLDLAALPPLRPASLPARGTLAVRLDTLARGVHALTAVTARVVLSDSLLSIPEATFEAWGGSGEATLWLGASETARQLFQLTLGVEDADADALLSALTPLDDAITGRLDLTVELAGAADTLLHVHPESLSGRAGLNLRDGTLGASGATLALAEFLDAEAWAEIPFWEARVDLEILERRVEVRFAELFGPRGRLALRGLVALDGSARLDVGLRLPAEQLGGVSLRRTGVSPETIARLRSEGSSLAIGLELSGPLGDPVLEPDASHADLVAAPEGP